MQFSRACHEAPHLGGAGLRPARAREVAVPGNCEGGGKRGNHGFPRSKTRGPVSRPPNPRLTACISRGASCRPETAALESEPPTLARRFPSGHGDTPLPAATSTARTVFTQTDHLLSAVRSAYASGRGRRQRFLEHTLHDGGRRAERPQLISRDVLEQTARAPRHAARGPVRALGGPSASAHANGASVLLVHFTDDKAVALQPAHESADGRRRDLLRPREGADRRRPAEDEHRQRRQSRRAQPTRLVHLADPPQQVNGSGVQAVGDLGRWSLTRIPPPW